MKKSRPFFRPLASDRPAPFRATSRLDDDDEVNQIHVTDSMGREQKTSIINEAGLATEQKESSGPAALQYDGPAV